MADLLKNDLKIWGPKNSVLGYVKWAPSASATQTLTEAQGVSSVTRSGAGAYAVNVKDPSKELVAVVGYRENDTTTYHFVRVESYTQSTSNGITRYTAINISHKSVVFASVASGPTASDTVDEITVWFIQRFND